MTKKFKHRACEIRDVPETVWHAFLARCDREGWARGPLLKELMRQYANGLTVVRVPESYERPKDWKLRGVQRIGERVKEVLIQEGKIR